MLRIVPAYWFVLTVVLLVYGTKGVSTPRLVSTYGFTGAWTDIPLAQYLGQAWTLRVEAFFYVLVPISAWLLFVIMRRLGAGLLRTAVAIGVPLAVAWTVAYLETFFAPNSSSPIVHLKLFMPGVLLAALETFLPARIARRVTGHSVRPHARCRRCRYHPLLRHLVPALPAPVGPAAPGNSGLSLADGGAGLPAPPPVVDGRLLETARQSSLPLGRPALVQHLPGARAGPRRTRAEARAGLDDNYWQTFVALLVAGIAGSVLLGVVVFRLVEAPFMNLKTSTSWRTSGRAAQWRQATLDSLAPAGAVLVERGRGAIPAMRRSRDEPAPEPAPPAECIPPPTVPDT